MLIFSTLLILLNGLSKSKCPKKYTITNCGNYFQIYSHIKDNVIANIIIGEYFVIINAYQNKKGHLYCNIITIDIDFKESNIDFDFYLDNDLPPIKISPLSQEIQTYLYTLAKNLIKKYYTDNIL